MLQDEIIERLSRLPSGGVINDQNRLDRGYLRSVLITFRNKLIVILYNGDRNTKASKRINPQCIQKYWPVYEKDLQEGNTFVLFRCPEFISLSENSDGLRYGGTIDGSCSFRRIASRSQLSNFNQNKITNVNNGRFTSFLYDGSQQMLEVYGNTEIKEMLIEGVFADPADVPTWNALSDPFPLADNDITLLEAMIYAEQTKVESLTPLVPSNTKFKNQ